MKTIRDILDKHRESVVTEIKDGWKDGWVHLSTDTLPESIALKEISELLLDCKPEKPIYDNRRSPKTTGKTHGTKDFVIGYSAGVDDYEKNIKDLL